MACDHHLTDDELLRVIKRVLGDPETNPNIYQLDEAHRRSSIAISIVGAISSLNGNPRGDVDPENWFWSQAGRQGAVETLNEDGDNEIHLDQFIEYLTENEPEFLRLISIEPDEELLTEFGVGAVEVPSLISAAHCDRRFMPGLGNNRLRRVAAICQIFAMFSQAGVTTRQCVQERWHACDIPEDELAVGLEENISGFTREVGLAQIRRLCGDPTAIKVDRRLSVAFPRLLGLPETPQDIRDRITALAQGLHRSDGTPVSPAELEHALYSWIGEHS